MMAKYQRKPIVVEVSRWWGEPVEWTERQEILDLDGIIHYNLYFLSAEGIYKDAYVGDYIITYPDGSKDVVCEHLFDEQYARVA